MCPQALSLRLKIFLHTVQYHVFAISSRIKSLNLSYAGGGSFGRSPLIFFFLGLFFLNIMICGGRVPSLMSVLISGGHSILINLSSSDLRVSVVGLSSVSFTNFLTGLPFLTGLDFAGLDREYPKRQFFIVWLNMRKSWWRSIIVSLYSGLNTLALSRKLDISSYIY